MKRVLVFLLVAILAYPSSAQNRGQVLSVLWKIQSPKTHQTSYLLGTLHLFGKDWLAAHPKIDSLLAISNVYMCEVIPSEQNTHDQQSLKKVKHLKARELFGEDYDKVNQYFVKNTGEGLTNIDNDDDPAEVLRGMTYFLQQDIVSKKGFNLSHDLMDNDLLHEAIAQHKLTAQLDNNIVARSITNGDNVNAGYIKSIVDMVDEANKPVVVVNPVEKMGYDLYQHGKFYFDFTSTDTSGETTAKAITRNKFWMGKLPEYLDKGKIFVAVGAGHLGGRDGVISLLRRKGYKVSPVDF